MPGEKDAHVRLKRINREISKKNINVHWTKQEFGLLLAQKSHIGYVSYLLLHWAWFGFTQSLLLLVFNYQRVGKYPKTLKVNK